MGKIRQSSLDIFEEMQKARERKAKEARQKVEEEQKETEKKTKAVTYKAAIEAGKADALKKIEEHIRKIRELGGEKALKLPAIRSHEEITLDELKKMETGLSEIATKLENRKKEDLSREIHVLKEDIRYQYSEPVGLPNLDLLSLDKAIELRDKLRKRKADLYQQRSADSSDKDIW